MFHLYKKQEGIIMANENKSNQNKTVFLNEKEFSERTKKTIYDFIKNAGESLYLPSIIPEMNWINNEECPLINIAEVNGNIKPIKFLKSQPIRDGIKINTKSDLVKTTLNERMKLLQEKHECILIRNLQELFAAEAESAGFIELEEREKWNFEERFSSPSIIHDPNKCVRCEACITTCRDIQGVDAITKDPEKGIIIDEDKCVRCGQCILSCPMGSKKFTSLFVEWMGCEMCAFNRPLGAMREIDDSLKVYNALKDPEKFVVVQFAPAVRVTIGEEFGIEPGTIVTNKFYASLRKAGFDKVWDTNFAADLTIMEEGSELIKRVKEGGTLPQLTSCSPGWIKYIETFHPSLLAHISSAKSPQQMFGPMAKTYASEKLNIEPEKIMVVSIMPCTAKKYECSREEMKDASEYWKEKGSDKAQFQDVDVVLTTREAAKLLKMSGINLAEMQEEDADPLLGEYTGAAPIFGRTGGVMEAALRTAYELLTGKPLEKLEFEDLGTLDGIKKATIPINGLEVKVAVVHGLKYANKVCESIENKGEFANYHFIEVMACPGGCVGGGGQIIATDIPTIKMRTQGVNKDDKNQKIRKSHENNEIKMIYKDFLKEPLAHLAHKLLHTHYSDRSASISKSNGLQSSENY
jgi:iron-only hydrogenase group A